MRDPTEERSLSTIIYFLVSLVIALVGLILLLSQSGTSGQSTTYSSIGASLLAGGVASVGFGLLRYIDDASERKLRDQISDLSEAFDSSFKGFRSEIANFVVDNAKSVRITSQASARTVSDVEISTRFRAEYARFSLTDNPVRVDVLGLRLYRFLDDQLDWLISQRHETSVRLLLQNPNSPVFEEICNLEARNLQTTRADIARTIETLEGAVVEGKSLLWRYERIQLELRFFNRYQPVTLFRVHDAIYVRPRVSTPQGARSRFYEVYEKRDSPDQYDVQIRHFAQCWQESGYSPRLAGGSETS